MVAPITALYASLIGLLLIYLALRVVKVRRAQKIGLGSGGDKSIEHAMRVQANATEYAPIAVILMLLLEINGTPDWLVHAYGATLVFARLYHLQGFGGSSGVSAGRMVGTALTWLVIVLGAVGNIVHFFVQP